MKRSTPPVVLVSSVPTKIRTAHDAELLMRIEAKKEKQREEKGGCKTLELPNKEEMEEILEFICQILVLQGACLLGVKKLGGQFFVYELHSNQSFLCSKRVNLWLNDMRNHATTKEIALHYKEQAGKYFASIEKAWNEKYTITETKSESCGIMIRLK